MNSLLTALALFLMLAPASAQPQDAPPDAPQAMRPNAEVVKLNDGLIITPLDVPGDLANKLLAIHAWRFNVRTLRPGARLSTRLELRAPGKAPVVINGVEISSAPKEFEYALALMPLETEFLMEAKKLRLHREKHILQNFEQDNELDARSLTTIDNPLLKLPSGDFRISYFPSFPGAVMADGSLQLMSFQVGQGPRTRLILVLTLKPDPEDMTPADAG